MLAPMEVARFGAGCVVFHDMIYVIGVYLFENWCNTQFK